jgi:hypothetical protein
MSNFAPSHREIVFSPPQILVERMGFRQIATVTSRWRNAAKLRKRNKTSSAAVYIAPRRRLFRSGFARACTKCARNVAAAT